MATEDANLEGLDLDAEELEPEGGDPIEVEVLEDDPEGPGVSDVAPPDRRLITQPYDLGVSDLVSQIPDRMHLQPVYQRRYVWDNKKASKLMESLLINVPIPVCYLAEETDGTRSVIDGQQRLRSLHRFLENQFALTGLEVLPELNRKRFYELTDRQQRLIRNRTIRCIVISEDSDPDIRFDVFERLNTGSVALTAQELRNSVYRGSFNQLLRQLGRSGELSRCVAGRSDTRMTFEELVLRFFALDERLTTYRPPLKRFLNDYMRDNRELSADSTAEKRDRFTEAATRAYSVYGGNCFRRGAGSVGDWEWLPAINSAVFDVVMLNLIRIDTAPQELAERADEIQHATAELMFENEDFSDAISLATGDRARLRRRVSIFSETLAELGLGSGLAAVLAD
ncbi:MAG: DUF262 domain-containing protein [Actinobacteria bacterium]|nr:DUF262 domain-containing protein [Actinomycetota bacterium]